MVRLAGVGAVDGWKVWTMCGQHTSPSHKEMHCIKRLIKLHPGYSYTATL